MRNSVGLLTWHYYSNFGSALQAYALQETVKKLGYSPEFVNYRNPKFGRVSSFKVFIHYVLGKVFGGKFKYPYIIFQKDFLNQSKLVHDKQQAQQMCKKYDAVICGSDQIWAPNAFNSLYMADFDGQGKTKKISYAASVGLNDIPEDKAGIYRNLLADFHKISVREEAGKELLEKECGVSATVVLDPTLLLTVDQYKKLSVNPFKENKKAPFVFCYFLNKNHAYRKKVEVYAKENGLEICGVSANEKDCEWMNVLNRQGPGEFLWLIENSSMIFTDSYHGTIFSLLFHKKFKTFERFSADDPICQNSRIYQLRDTYGLDERILSATAEIKEDDYDYAVFEKKLEELRCSSLLYLKEAL